MAQVPIEEATPAGVAQFINDLLVRDPYLTQEAAADRIRECYGDGFLCTGEDGTPTVSMVVLTVFRERFRPPARWPLE